VVQVIEQQMSGLDHLLYLSSNADDSGAATTTLTFEAGTNPDIAQVQVQNKLQLATPLLPSQVQQTGIRVTKSSSSYLLFAASCRPITACRATTSPTISLERTGSAKPHQRGRKLQPVRLSYAMRIWLDTDKLNSFALTPVDVTSAIQSQNVQVAGGQLGGTRRRRHSV